MPNQRGQPEILAERLTRPGGSRRTPIDHGHYHIRITRDGRWHYRDTLIGREPLVKLFASVLVMDRYGQYWLQTPAEKGRIDVDDAPFTAVALETSGSGRDQVVRFRTNLDEVVPLDEDHPLRVGAPADRGGPAPYVLVRDRLDALILRSVYYDLVDRGGNGEGKHAADFGVWSRDAFFVLGERLDPA